MKYSLAKESDAAFLAALEQTQPQSALWGKKGLLQELKNKAARIWCAQEQEKIMGFVCARIAADMAEIVNLAVHPAHCRQGIGFSLLQCLLEDLKQQGAHEVLLEVHVQNNPAQRLYQKVGFIEVGRRKNFYHDGADALLLKKVL